MENKPWLGPSCSTMVRLPCYSHGLFTMVQPWLYHDKWTKVQPWFTSPEHYKPLFITGSSYYLWSHRVIYYNLHAQCLMRAAVCRVLRLLDISETAQQKTQWRETILMSHMSQGISLALTSKRTHESSHGTETIWCSVCSRRFTQAGNLHMHSRIYSEAFLRTSDRWISVGVLNCFISTCFKRLITCCLSTRTYF